VALWARDYQEIDVFNWQEAVKDMVSSAELEVQLATTEGKVRSAVERGAITPDHTLVLGERTYYYFQQDRAEEVRERLGLPQVTDESIRTLFLGFVNRMDMATSYKPVMLKAILDHVDDHGKARIDDVVQSFLSFYRQRHQRGLPVERPTAKMSKADQLSKDEARIVMLTMPFEKFERRKYLQYDKGDLAFLRFSPALWRQLTADDLGAIQKACDDAITAYYEQQSEKRLPVLLDDA
jgi:hypothetical protein